MAVGLVGLIVGMAAAVYAADAGATGANGATAQQLMDDARKLSVAHNYEAALKRLQQVNRDQLGFWDKGAYESLVKQTETAIAGKAADEKAFADGREALNAKRYATAIAKLSQAADSKYLEDEKVGPARSLCVLAQDGQAKANEQAVALIRQGKDAIAAGKVAEARKDLDQVKALDVKLGWLDSAALADLDKKVAEAEKAPAKAPVAVAAKPAEAPKAVAAPKPAEKPAPAKPTGPSAGDIYADAQKLYDTGRFDEALAKAKSIKKADLGFFVQWGYDGFIAKCDKAIAGRAADEKALAAGKADLAAKKYDLAMKELSQVAGSSYLAKDQVIEAKNQLAMARGEVEMAAAEKAAADKKAADEQAKLAAARKAEAERAAAQAKADRLAADKKAADEQAKLAAAKKAEAEKAAADKVAADKKAADEQAKLAAAKRADAERAAAQAKADKLAADKKAAEEQAKLAAAKKADAEKAVAEKAAAEKAVADKAAADKKAAEEQAKLAAAKKADADKMAAEEQAKLVAAKKADAEKAAAEKAAADKAAADKLAADKKAADEQAKLAAAKKADAEKAVADKAAADKAAADKLAADKKAADEQAKLAAAKKAEAEKAVADKAAAEKAAADKAALDKLAAARKAELDKAAAEKAAADKAAADKLAADKKVAADKAKADAQQAALAKAEADRKAQQAQTLLTSAKKDLDAGRLAEARKDVTDLKALNVKLGFFDNIALSGIERKLAAAEAAPAKAPTAVKAPAATVVSAPEAPAVAAPAAPTAVPVVAIPVPVVAAPVAPVAVPVAALPAPAAPQAPAVGILVQAKHAEAEDEMKAGAEDLAQHEYLKARIHYQKALELWPDNERAKEGLQQAMQLTGERETPLWKIEKETRSLDRQRIIADIQDLLAQAERAAAKAERPEDYNEALRPLAQADRTIDVATALTAEEQEAEREKVLSLKKQITAKKAAVEASRAKKAVAEARTAEEMRRDQDKRDRENKVSQLWERATELRKSMQFQQAIEVLDRLLAVDPNDERALRWRDDLLYLESQSEQVRIRTEREAQAVESLADVERMAIHPGDKVNGVETWLRYPAAKDWKSLTEFRRDFTKAVTAEPRQVSETRRRLSEEIDLDFEKTSLDNVLKYISDVQKGLNIVIDPDIATGGIDLSTRVVDLKVKRISVESVLGLILGADLGYRVEPGYILITTKEKLQQNLPVVTYPVQDLVAEIPDFGGEAPRFEVGTVAQAATQAVGGGGGGGFGNIFGQQQQKAATGPVGWQELTDIIKRTVNNNSEPRVAAWSDEGGPSAIEYMNGLLIVTQTRRGHEKVADLLEQLRRERAIMISVEARFCTVTDEFLQDITLDVDAAFANGAHTQAQNFNGSPTQNVGATTTAAGSVYNTLPGVPADVNYPVQTGQPIIVSNTGSNGMGTASLLPVNGTVFGSNAWTSNANQGGMVVSGVFLDDIQVGFLLRAIQADVRQTTLQAPRVTLYNGQRSYISVATVTTYIANVTPVVAEAAVGWDPTVGAIPVGVTLDVKATVSADRRYVQMDLRPQVADIEGFNHSTVQAAVPGGSIASAVIDLPQVRVQDFKTTVSVPDGGTLLLGGTRQYLEGEAETGVPILSKIPIIKRLFNNRATVRRANNLLILMRPKILIQAEEEHKLGYDNF
jgi:type II secretory pathway component GspD/PulD (secretin)